MRKVPTLVLLVMLLALSAFAQVVIVNPTTTAKFISSDKPESTLQKWNGGMLELVRQSELKPIFVDEAALTDATPKSTIILHHATCLSDQQLTALREHLNEGNGLWITSDAGYRDEKGAIRGWGFLQELLEGEIDSTSYEIGSVVSLYLRYGHPGSSQLPPGYRFRLAALESPLAVKSYDSNDVVGWWADEKYTEKLPDLIPRQAGFIARSTLTGGRIVWMGAGLEGVHVDSTNNDAALTMISGLLRWLEGGSISSIDAWPDGYSSAVLIHGDIEDQFESVERLTKIFSKYNVPVTYNLLTSEAAKYPKALEKILSTHAELSIHGDTHNLFSGQPLETQIQRIDLASRFITKYGPRPTTFRPPELAYDEVTVQAARKSGITAFLAFDRPDRDYPILSSFPRSTAPGLVFFPKGELDDYDLFVKVPLKPNSDKAQVFLGDFERIYDLHGLYKLNFHSQFLTTDELPRAIEDVLVEWKNRRDVWITDAHTIAQWIDDRSRLKVESTSDMASVHLRVTNTAPTEIKDAVVRILPPRNIPAELLVPTKVSRSCEYDVAGNVLLVTLPALKPGELFDMDLGFGDGHKLNAFNKNIFSTALKVMGAFAIIFVIWMVVYLAFSGKKLSTNKHKHNVNDPSDNPLYRKLDIKPSSASKEEVLSEESSTELPNSSSFFPTIPDLGFNKSHTSKSNFRNDSTYVAVEVRSDSHKHGMGYILPLRNSRVPSLPVVLQPLTMNDQKHSLTRKVRKSKRHAKISNSVKPAIPAQKEPAMSSDAIRQSATVQGSPNRPEPKAPITATSKSASIKPVLKAASYNSPAGMRTTALLPSLQAFKPQSTHNFTDSGSPEQESGATQPGRIRNSVDIIRRNREQAAQVEEWR